MCGATAVFGYHPSAPPVETDELRSIRDRMGARGPDGAGEWFSDDGRVALGHRRLAIIDLDARAAQPMRSPSGHAWVSYNGEIYNFRALRAELEREHGVEFRTQSDTEVLVAGYEAWGERVVERLRGMFAFALWDARRGAMLLARDPYGIKPLYLADDGWTVRVASQVKALRASPRVSGEIEPAAQVGFLLFGHVPEPHTWYRDIRAVRAGSVQWVDECGPRTPRIWFDLAAALAGRIDGAGEADPVVSVRESVGAHLEADVPVAIFLSAGLDSAAVLGAAQAERREPLQAITLGFAEYHGTPRDEVPLAAQSAAVFGSRHHVERVSRDEWQGLFEEFLGAADQPSIDGFNTWLVARAAKRSGFKVALSGVGGDELFGGYDSFRRVPALLRRLGWSARIPGLGRMVRSVGAPVMDRLGVSNKWAGLIEFARDAERAWLLQRALFLPQEARRQLPAELWRDGWRRLDLFRALREGAQDDDAANARVAALESGWYLRNQLLRDADWAGMAHGVEIRTPLVDARLALECAPRARREGKKVLARVPPQGLPPALLSRPKTGFGTPLGQWMAGASALSEGRASRAVARRVLDRYA